MNIPFYDLRLQHKPIQKDLITAVSDVIKSNWFLLGQEIAIFENQYAEYSNCKYCLGMSNGLDALTISLRALGVGKGDEVIIPSNTFIATALAVSFAGATPILAEPDPNTYLLTSSSVVDKVTPQTKAVIPVHLYGNTVNMLDILAVTQPRGIFVIEDNAQAQGAVIADQKTGTWGHINATSFYPGKNLGAMGDAGCITTNDASLYEQALRLRNYGSKVKYHHELKGMNCRMDEIQAAVLKIKLRQLDNWNSSRIRVARLYNDLLCDLQEIVVPQFKGDLSHVYHQYVIRVKERDNLKAYLKDKGVSTSIHYPIPIHLQTCYEDLKLNEGSYPIAESLSKELLSLPMYPGLTPELIEFIAEQIRAFYRDR